MALQHLTEAINKIIEKYVLKAKSSPYSKHWQTKKLSALQKTSKMASRQAYKQHMEPNHKVHIVNNKVRQAYAIKIEKVKKKHWEQWLKELKGEKIWMANKYVDSLPIDSRKAHIPTLKCQEQIGCIVDIIDNKAKSKYLFDSFFSQN